MMMEFFRSKGLCSLMITGSLAIVTFPLTKSLPGFSLLSGYLGTFMVVLAMENEVQRYLEERELEKDVEVRHLTIDWPNSPVTLVKANQATLWQMVRPHVVSDLLLRNAQTALPRG